MSKAITVTLPVDLTTEIEEAVREDGVSEIDLIQKAVKAHLAIRRLDRLRAKLVPHARSQGIHSDQDVFDRVS